MARAPLWSPAHNAKTATALGRFMSTSSAHTARRFETYHDLWSWSVTEPEEFWREIWQFFPIKSTHPFSQVLVSRTMPGARWFEGTRLNYAEHLTSRGGEGPAIIGRSQSRQDVVISWDEFREQVARARTGLLRIGVRKGDRVAAYLPNIPEAIIAFAAAASIGAVWTSCAPEFGAQSVVDRFAQVEPKVLLTITGYRFGPRKISRTDEVSQIIGGLPSLNAIVNIQYGDADMTGIPIPSSLEVMDWSELIRQEEPLVFEQVEPDHPLYVLYSSGTTGLPKAIVHGHAGILVEHFKVLGLHADLKDTDRFFWFTTTGWMMWNLLVSGLLLGSTVVTFDGDPNEDGPATLWALADTLAITWFGVGAPTIETARRSGLRPGDEFNLSSLRAVGSTGSPLSADGFRWVYDAVNAEVLLSSMSGGTDVCSAFVGGSPLSPVWAGEIPARYLGAAVHAFDETGRPVLDREGELVITMPMPSMPIRLWGDDDGATLRSAYFSGPHDVWQHGDWVTVTSRGTCIITGRSDATLNRGGVRIGTAELYGTVEAVPGVVDSLVVHVESSGAGDEGRLLLFVVLSQRGSDHIDAVRNAIRQAIRRDVSPRHVPDEIEQVASIPTTLSGKKLEIPVKRILQGARATDVASRDALRDPNSLLQFEQFTRQHR